MEQPKAPQWYYEEEIHRARADGSFFEPGAGETESKAIARHLQLAFEKGYSIGWGRYRMDAGLEHETSCKAADDRATAAEEKVKALELQNQELKRIMAKLEWSVECRFGSPKFYCPCCDNDKATGHSEDCELGHALHGAFPPGVTEKR